MCVIAGGCEERGPIISPVRHCSYGFHMRCGGGSETNVLSLPPGKNITYGAMQNTRFQAADRPKTQRRTLTARQEKGLQHLYTGTVYYSLGWNVTWKKKTKKQKKQQKLGVK